MDAYKVLAVVDGGIEVVEIAPETERLQRRDRALAEMIGIAAAGRAAALTGASLTDESLGRVVDDVVRSQMERRWPGMPFFGDYVVAGA